MSLSFSAHSRLTVAANAAVLLHGKLYDSIGCQCLSDRSMAILSGKQKKGGLSLLWGCEDNRGGIAQKGLLKVEMRSYLEFVCWLQKEICLC